MAATRTATADERMAQTPFVRKLMARPELGAMAGTILVFIFFAVVAGGSGLFSAPGIINFLEVSAQLGIIAVAAAMLMIGGEFDLSAGVMTGTGALLVAILSTIYGWNIWLAIAAAVAAGALVGLVNGLMVMRTGLPSFIVTLGTLLILQGLNLGVTKLLTGTVQVRKVADADGYASAREVLASTVQLGGGAFRVTILWWVGAAALATWILLRTRVGNWIFAVGGSARAARSVGVPVARTKIGLFMAVSMTAALVGAMRVVRLTSAQANAGLGEELQFIIAAVIGGCLLTGGYGSAVGAAIGALIFGMAKQGIVFAGWDADWFQLFLGLLLVLAALLNKLVRRHAESAPS